MNGQQIFLHGRCGCSWWSRWGSRRCPISTVYGIRNCVDQIRVNEPDIDAEADNREQKRDAEEWADTFSCHTTPTSVFAPCERRRNLAGSHACYLIDFLLTSDVSSVCMCFKVLKRWHDYWKQTSLFGWWFDYSSAGVTFADRGVVWWGVGWM